MADYELLSKITGFSIYIKDEYISAVSNGYTYATPFVCRVNLAANTSPAQILNGCSLVWSFGDGTYKNNTYIIDNNLQTESQIYNWPGIYELKLSVTSNDGLSSKTFSKTLNIANYSTDSLEWVYTGWSDLLSANVAAGAVFHGFQSCKPGNLDASLPLTFRYTTSTTLSEKISFDLYSENSSSQPWDVPTYENKYANLRPRWRFLDIDENIITNIKPASGQIFPIIIDASGRVPGQPGYVDSQQTVVGYTGTLDFYYIDDIPSLTYNGGFSVSVPTLWVTSNTNLYPNYQDKNDSTQPSYSNSVVTLSSYFYVKNLSADHFKITVNGGNINIPTTLWPQITGNFFITINSSTSASDDSYKDKVLLNCPITYSNTSIILSSSNGAATFAASSFNFSRKDSYNRDTGGFYKNTFYTLNNNSNLLSTGTLSTEFIATTLSATTIVEPSANALSGYNPSTRVAAANATANTLRVIPISGHSNYVIKDFNKSYFVRKINEDFNYGAQLKTYALQPTIAANDNLFAFLSAMAGDSYTADDTFGTKIYERISNFTLNIQDIDTAGVNELYSLSELINNQFDNYNFNPPPVLKRAFDLFSVSHERLWGTREKYNTNFNNAEYHTNLGTSLTAYNIDTAIVSAGQKIVLNDIYNSNYYELIEVPAITSYAAVTAANMQAYFSLTATYPLTSYPLSAFFGWGVKTPVKQYYKFWVYKDSYSNTPTNNSIDWSTKTDGLSTTLSETTSSIAEWYKDGGTLENIYSYYLYKGLDLL